MVTLPEEYFCPKVPFDDPWWTNRWPRGRYACKAVHSHYVTDEKASRVWNHTRWEQWGGGASEAAGGSGSSGSGLYARGGLSNAPGMSLAYDVGSP